MTMTSDSSLMSSLVRYDVLTMCSQRAKILQRHGTSVGTNGAKCRWANDHPNSANLGSVFPPVTAHSQARALLSLTIQNNGSNTAPVGREQPLARRQGGQAVGNVPCGFRYPDKFHQPHQSYHPQDLQLRHARVVEEEPDEVKRQDG